MTKQTTRIFVHPDIPKQVIEFSGKENSQNGVAKRVFENGEIEMYNTSLYNLIYHGWMEK